MKAIALHKEESSVFKQVEWPRPELRPHDLLVAVRAISVNPVDTKIRANIQSLKKGYRVLGWDAAGEVIETGSEVTNFTVGDKVFYAGDITRDGSNSELQAVDQRIVGKLPSSLSFGDAAALPLTTITSWEALFERLGIYLDGNNTDKSILIIGAAGGVGSMAMQLARLAGLKVIASASRSVSADWCRHLGASEIVNHRNCLAQEFSEQKLPMTDYILCLNSTEQHWEAMTEIIAPQGRICSIVESSKPLDISLLKSKSVQFSWEFMFTRSMYQNADMIEQQSLLNRVAELIDQGKIRCTRNATLRPINVYNLYRAHQQVEVGHSIGKLVLEDWA